MGVAVVAVKVISHVEVEVGGVEEAMHLSFDNDVTKEPWHDTG